MPLNKTRFERLPSKSRGKHFMLLASFSVALVLFIGIGIFIYFQHTSNVEPPTYTVVTRPKITYAFDDIPSGRQPGIIQLLKILADHQNKDLAPSKTDAADILVTSMPHDNDLVFTTSGKTQLNNITSSAPLSTTTEKFGLRLADVSRTKPEDITKALAPTYSPAPPSWTYLAVGDIIPARDVYTYSKRYGFLYPYTKVSDTLKQADLTVANVETTIADGQANGEGAGMMVFTAPSQAFQGLVESGIDGINLANNHAMNGGGAKVTEMLAGLDARQIGHFGVSTTNGVNTWATTVKGIKVTHLSFNTVPGSIEPTTSTPGARRISLKPWGSLSDNDIALVQEQIKAAKQSSDVVIPWFQWGTEYTHDANDEQRRLAHAAIDAGAEVVIGTHPHWTQGIEWYNGHFIAYSLGNFIFDQNWSDETRRSFTVQLAFTGTKVTGVRLFPAYIENWVQPRFLAPSESLYQQILADIASHSWWE
ncbi:CapA family protein [bacterium]|nr:CapA family protein [bacterium]